MKFGFIKAQRLGSTRKTEIKIGSKTYKNLLNDYRQKQFKKIDTSGSSKKIRKELKAINDNNLKYKLIGELFNSDRLSTISDLVKNKVNMETDTAARIKQILLPLTRKKYFIKFKAVGDNEFSHVFTIRNENLNFLTKMLSKRYWVEKDRSSGSDELDLIYAKGISEVEFEKAESGKKLFKKNAKFFKYLNTTDIDLTRYQIIKGENEKEILNDHCLTYAMSKAGVEDKYIKSFKTTYNCGVHFSKSNLGKASSIIKKGINLTFMTNDAKAQQIQQLYNPDKHIEVIEIAMFEEHFFINETTEFSTYASKNYDKIKQFEKYETITGFTKSNKPIYGDHKKLTSYQLIRNMFDCKLFLEESFLSSYQPT